MADVLKGEVPPKPPGETPPGRDPDPAARDEMARPGELPMRSRKLPEERNQPTESTPARLPDGRPSKR